MGLFSRRAIALIVACLFLPSPAYACPLFSVCKLHEVANATVGAATNVGNAVVKAATDTGKAVEDAVSAGGQVIQATGDGLKTLAGAGVTVLRGAGQLATGHPGDAWASIKEGGQEMVNGVLDVVVADGAAAVTMADPLIGRVVFGTPSVMQSLAKFLYDTIEHWVGRPACNPAAEVTRFMTIPKREIDERSRIGGAATTPMKYLSSIFGGPSAWKDTGCDGGGIGRPIRSAQHSLDNFYTVDVAISDVRVRDVQVLPGRYVRLEIFPGLAAYDSVEKRLPGPNDVISFSGPLMWDKDTDTDHPNGHMEIHPTSSINFGISSPVLPTRPPSAAGTGTANGSKANITGGPAPRSDDSPLHAPEVPTKPTTSGTRPDKLSRGNPTDVGIAAVLSEGTPKDGRSPPGYHVIRGDNLSAIATRIYGKPHWERIFCVNRKLITNPDLIYPGQVFSVPIAVNGMMRCDLRDVPRSYHR